MAETIDWAHALTQLDCMALDPDTINNTLGTLLKYQDDIAKIRGSEASRLLERGPDGTGHRRSGLMTAQAPDGTGGRLPENIMHFGRVLRAAGLPVGPGKVLDAIRAVAAVGIGNRTDFYWALHAVFVNRRDQRELFDQAFHIFWRNPRILERMMSLMLPQFRATRTKTGRRHIDPDRAGAGRRQE